MDCVKKEIKSLLSENIKLVKGLTSNLNPYLEYFALINFNTLKTFISSVEYNSLFFVTGAEGCGKNSFNTIVKNAIETSVQIFEYNCSEVTELDDIFFAFYKFMMNNPFKRSVFAKYSKSFIKPASIDEQIMRYLKDPTTNIILVFKNAEKLLDNNLNCKNENMQSFFEFLSTLVNIKTIIYSTVNFKNALALSFCNYIELELLGLEVNQVSDFFKIFKTNVSANMIPKIYDITNGYLYSLKFLAYCTKALDVSIEDLINSYNPQNGNFTVYLAKKIIINIPNDAKELLIFLAAFRHEISEKVLNVVSGKNDTSKIIKLLQDAMLLEGEDKYELRPNLKTFLYDQIPVNEKISLHEKIADFYADQIPMKPNERAIEISRTSMYSEKFYHYNLFSKLSKNLELQVNSERSNFIEKQRKNDYQRIKYIASTQYIPDFVMKKSANTEDKSKDKEIENKIITNKKTQLSANFYDNSDELQQYSVEASQTPEDILKKGLDLFQAENMQESISYLKNAMKLFNGKDETNFYLAKYTLSRALIEVSKYDEANILLFELLDEKDLSVELKADVMLEQALICEYTNNISEAFELYNRLIPYVQQNNLKHQKTKTYFKLALLYDDQNDIDNALENYLLVTEDATDVLNYTILASTYSNIASIYEEKNDFEKAVEYFNKSLQIDELLENYEGQAKSLSEMGNIFVSQKKFNSALKIFIKATKVAQKTDDNYLIASAYLELGDTFFSTKDYKNAIKAFVLAQRNINTTISTDTKNKIARRFKLIADEIGEDAYNFLLKELKNS